MRLKRPLLLGIIVTLAGVSAGCTGNDADSRTRSLTVFAAASLTDAFTQIGRDFEAEHPGVNVVFNFGGSQNLRTQIEQGAPADVFAPANVAEMDRLIAQGLVAVGAPRAFLTNGLVLILPEGNPAAITSIEDLRRPGLKLVLAAAEVPAGRYARQVLLELEDVYGQNFAEDVLANLVSNEDNIRQAVTKVQLGEADASIVYVSDAVAAPALQKIQIPDAYNVTAEYLIAPLADAAEAPLAEEFITYVLSPEGQTALAAWGFTPVER